MWHPFLRWTIAGLLLIASFGAVQADQLTFKVPVEFRDISNLSRVTVSCIISKDPMAELIGESADFSKQATSRQRRNLTLYRPDDVRCQGGSGNPLCMRPGKAGLSWQGTINMTIHDFDNGGLAVADARQYVCKTTVGYLRTGKRSDGVSILADRNCKATLQYLETYRAATGNDIADHLLCRQANLNDSPALIKVPPMHLHGGAPKPDHRFEDLSQFTTVESRQLRSGRRYADFSVNDYKQCARACLNDDDCQAWSGYDSHRGGRCYLMSTVPAPRSACTYCVTGKRKTESGRSIASPDSLKAAIRAALDAYQAGDACHAARILAPFADDPKARSMRAKFQSDCRN